MIDSTRDPHDVDIAVLGGGPAGLGVVLALDALVASSPGTPMPSVAVVDPVRRRGRDRTWCFWDTSDGDVARLVAPAVSRSWRRTRVVAADGRVLDLDLDPLHYMLVASDDYYAHVEAVAARRGVTWVEGAAGTIGGPVGDSRRVIDVDGGVGLVRARVVLDCRPAPPRRPGRTRWLQHFAGWSMPAAGDPAPAPPVFMDFRAPAPARGVGFGYVVPDAAPGGATLVEYTVFGPAADAAGTDYAAAARAWLALDGVPASVTAGPAQERGAIPMTDAVPAAALPGTVRLGAGAGATRASTGYAFAAMHRQALAVARAVLDGARPDPDPGEGRLRVPAAYPARHRWMDSVLLRALDSGLVAGPDLFVRLFDRLPAERVLRFLDGLTTPAEDLSVMWAAPRGPMLRATVRDTAHRWHAPMSALIERRPFG